MNIAIVEGNIFDGITLYGPFENAAEAIVWADNNIEHKEWLVAILNDPNEEIPE